MPYKAKENILNFKEGDIVDSIQPNWEPYFEEIGYAKKKELDLNKDGKIDKIDASIASKVLKDAKKKGK